MPQVVSSTKSPALTPLVTSDRVAPTSSPDTDRFLMAIAEGDHEAFAELFQRYARVMLALARRIVGSKEEAEEVLQEVFLYAWKKAESFNPERSSLSTWLTLIARSRAIDRLRKSSSLERTKDQIRYEPRQTRSAGQAVASVLDGERRRRVRGALDKLPVEQRQVMELAYFVGLTQAEIAEQTRIPLGTVKTRTQLAMRKLRRELAAEVADLI